MSAPRINTVVASAGAGKTTRIVSEIANEVAVRAPEQIVATTFTVKAAAELIERSRAKLFENGRSEEASRLLGARFGTVNAVCGQIVAENAIELGRSPRADMIPEGSVSQLFKLSASPVIERYAPELNALADAFGFFEPKQAPDAERSDWRTTVRRLIELARANGLDAKGLRRSAELSAQSFLQLLPPPNPSIGASLDIWLRDAVQSAVAVVPGELSKTAKEHIGRLRLAHSALARGEQLSWPDWARLSKATCAKKDGPALVEALEAVNKIASRHPEHPRLRDDCERFIRALFGCAAEALDAFQSYKSERGLLDFIDQETLALEVLRDPAMAERLGERIGRVFVDEFQDSSPLQIAIFTAMADLVEASTWVGDPKQAIYGFRNADSALTMAAFKGVAATSPTPQEVLSTSYRSRQGIIDLVNAAFGPAFGAMGLPPEEHAFSKTARREEGFSSSPFAVWWLDGKIELQLNALAAGVRDTIAQGADWPVGLKPSGVRPLTAGDVAILCRSNADVMTVAGALSGLGVKVAVEREGLAQTPHVELVMAAFRWVADPTDRLALAELARFFQDDPVSDLWLRAAGAEDQDASLQAAVPISGALTKLRGKVLALTPADLVDAIIALPDVTRRLETWGDYGVRLDDLEALRGFARSYEASCAGSGTPATLSGLVLALASDEPKRPKSLQSDAVKVMTYHSAKGLEWPMVILTGLGKGPRARLFEPVAEVEGELDWRDPLAKRWIRYWPWPYASQSKDVGLDEKALQSRMGQAALLRAKEEETRLLYVGVTRARDHVIFAPPTKGELKWLTVLDTDRVGHLALPSGAENVIQIGDATFGARVSPLLVDDQEVATNVRPTFVSRQHRTIERPALYRRPSAEGGGAAYSIVERVQIGPRLPFSGQPDMLRLGEAVHATFAADILEAAHAERLTQASAILERWGIHEVAPADVLAAHDRLHDHLEKAWPKGMLKREVPVFARLEDQLISGRIDLLMEDDDGFAVIDHKSFPGSRDQWEARALGYGPQLELYGRALTAASGRTCDRLYIHMPIVGVLLRVSEQKVGD
jgi:ATP-dependent helicase/nuclease subunit A